MADSAEIVEPTSPTSGAAGPGGSARSAGPDRPAAAGASIRLDNLTKRYPDSQAPAVEDVTRDEAAGETVIATPATSGVGGGLGDLGSSGITNQRMPVPVLGFVLTVAMALIMDWLGTLVGLLLRPRGLEVD
ncbi:hypothetical protein Sgleb_73850 [Streptomyces glebosus]|uniref:Uncharacterized protein n=1 Tax=Streptomyces glebosus TaxID=249580 RepID=A0A640T7Q9_9ACTN|nr:hypothetical protein Sgleb_73850 [Streptomyces glebosus]GHG62417.1 hypothetical protein GCM10010513_29070 [Streptomyces glebosus]